MNLGVETHTGLLKEVHHPVFQHSLMNLGVETRGAIYRRQVITAVSAFSDESWGGDP